MGRSKQLLPLGDKLLIHHCLDNLFQAGLPDITVVTRHDGEEVREAVSSYSVQITVNTDHRSDMAGSVRCGLSGIPSTTTGVLISLVDHPLVQVSTLEKIGSFHHDNQDRILLPTYLGKKGHPVLFPANLIENIFTMPTLRDIMRSNTQQIAEIKVDDRGIIMDTDTPEDYQRAIEYYRILHEC